MSAAKKKGLDFGAAAARQVQREAAASAAGPDRFQRAHAALAGPPSLFDVDEIQDREQSTREIDGGHVAALAESIAALGLIEPIVVDTARRLLAGGHRLAAIKALRSSHSDAFERWFAGGVPVRVMDFDAEAAPARALEVEIAENEHRRDYTSSQVKALVARLREAGYRETVGRPKAGEKALGPALEVIVGKSMKTIRKLLVEGAGEAEGSHQKPEHDPLAGVLRVFVKQRKLLPGRLLPQFDALVQALELELKSRLEQGVQ